MPRNLNICLHNIVDTENQLHSIYDITREQLITLNSLLQTLIGTYYESYTLYFDDGYRSFHDIVSTIDLGLSKENIRCAVIVDQLDTSNKLTTEQVIKLSSAGYGIDSHGMSHAALASFKNGILQTTPNGGIYQNQQYGQREILTKKEVLFQVAESQAALSSMVDKMVTNFVLPYGLYNNQTLEIIVSKTQFSRILTCHTAYDTGQVLVPRLLITQANITRVEDIINELNEDYILLTELNNQD